MMSVLTLKTLRELWRRKGTVLALMAIMALGIGEYICLHGVYADVSLARARYYQQYHLADFQMNVKRAPEAIRDPLLAVPNVAILQNRIKADGMVSFSETTGRKPFQMPIPATILSYPASASPPLNSLKLQTGRWFSNPYAEEVIVEQQFAAARHLTPGSRLFVRLFEKERQLLVVGTAYSPEYIILLPPGNAIAPDPANYAVLFMPEKYLQEATDLRGAFNELIGTVYDDRPIAVKNTMDLLAEKLDPYGVQFKTPKDDQASYKMLHDKLQGVRKMSTVFPMIFLFVAVLVLNVMMARFVAQQRTAIGTLKALGYSRARILLHYLNYGTLIGLGGGLLGILFGTNLHYQALILYRRYFCIPGMIWHPDILVWFQGMSISVVSGWLGAYWGAQKAMRLAPAEAMRPPVPEKIRHVFLEDFPTLWLSLSFLQKMIIRTIFRNPFRSAVTLLACSLATMLLVCSLSFIDSINKISTSSFDKVQHQDFTLSLREPLGRDIFRTAQLLPGVDQVEASLTVPVELKNGPYSRLISVTGLPAHATLSTPVDDHDKPIILDRSGLIISNSLAESLHVKQGDVLSFRPLLGQRKQVTVGISRVFTTYFSISAYCDQPWLSLLLGDQWVANQLLFKLKQNFNPRVFALSTYPFAPMINLIEARHAKETLVATLNSSMTFFITLMITFSAIITLGALMNAAIISLSERERDVASLRVLGFTHFQVAKIFFGESCILNAIGLLVGLGLGIILTYLFTRWVGSELFRLPVVIRFSRLLQAILIIVGFILLSHGMIYRMIRKMNWFEVLNNRE